MIAGGVFFFSLFTFGQRKAIAWAWRAELA